jgi:periplasmic divalent cation tolerance protein
MTIKMIWTTCSQQEAQKLARSLLQSRLIACANIFEPHTALYWWKGDICEDQEVTLIMETDAQILPKTLDEMTRLHSYDNPKIMVFSPDNIPTPFQKWLRSEVNIDLKHQ